MLSLILIADSEKERNILTMAFEQRGLKVLHSGVHYKNYVYVMQYLPDAILIEIPYKSSDQLSFIRRLRQFKRSKSIAIIGYGDQVVEMVANGIRESGISFYFDRPLKFSKILLRLEYLLKLQKKTLAPLPEPSAKEQDIALLMQSDVLPMQKIEVLVKYVTNLFAFPFTVAKVLKITQDEKTGAGELTKAVSADPHLAAFILKISNTVFFASANHKISSVKEAIVRIGFNETKRIVLGMTVMNLFDKANKNVGFDRTDFWYHALATALIAEQIARNFGTVSLEEAFLAGLLHDLGIMLLDDFFPMVFSPVLEATSKNALLFNDVEKDMLKVTHLDMIAELFPKWRIPEEIAGAVTGQYSILLDKKVPENPTEKLALCVAIGNATAKLLHFGRECDDFVLPIDNSLMRAAKLSNGFTPAMIDNIKNQMSMYSQFLNMERREHQCECPEGIAPDSIAIGIFNPESDIFVPPALFLAVRSIRYEPVFSDTDFTTYHDRFHLIIYWSSTGADVKEIERLSTIRRNMSLAPDSTENVTAMPLIVFSPTHDENQTGSENFVQLPSATDYRLLEESIIKLLTGQK